VGLHGLPPGLARRAALRRVTRPLRSSLSGLGQSCPPVCRRKSVIGWLERNASHSRDETARLITLTTTSQPNSGFGILANASSLRRYRPPAPYWPARQHPRSASAEEKAPDLRQDFASKVELLQARGYLDRDLSNTPRRRDCPAPWCSRRAWPPPFGSHSNSGCSRPPRLPRPAGSSCRPARYPTCSAPRAIGRPVREADRENSLPP
jgi:hypothetical protein